MNKTHFYPTIFLILATLLIFTFLAPSFFDKKSIVYNSNYSKNEIEFGIKNVYTKAKTEKDAVELYFLALKQNDKMTVKLLSMPPFATISPDIWDAQFEAFWSRYKGRSFEYGDLSFDEKEGCQGVSIKLQNSEQRVEKFACLSKSDYIKTEYLFFFGKYSYYSIIVWD